MKDDRFVICYHKNIFLLITLLISFYLGMNILKNVSASLPFKAINYKPSVMQLARLYSSM